MDFFARYAFEIIALAWIVSTSRDSLFWLNFIQLKQYRFDRIAASLKDIRTWKLIAHPLRLTALFLLAAWEIGVRLLVSRPAFDALIFATAAFFLFQTAWTIVHMKRRSLQLPAITLKIAFLFGVVLLFQTAVLSWYGFWPEQTLALFIANPFIVLFFFMTLRLPNALLLRWRIRQATRYRESLTNLVVVGVTGSYGKTTTKEYLAHILSAHAPTAKTPSHVNVDTGVAKTLLQAVKPHHKYFVVEMGAYRRGEVADICRIVKPGFGIITAISNQHLELFGSQDQLTATKLELFEAIANDQGRIANSESPLLFAACEKMGYNPVWYGRGEKAALRPADVTRSADQTAFTLAGTVFQAPIASTGAFLSLLAAITAAQQLGMPLPKIAEAMKQLPTIEKSMQLRHGANGSVIIDSTYNASTEAVLAAIEDLSIFGTEKRAVVFKNIIELGEETSHDHERIAKTIAEKTDFVLLLTSPQQSMLKKVLLASGMREQQIFDEASQADFLRLINEQTAVLFAGRGTERFLPRLL